MKLPFRNKLLQLVFLSLIIFFLNQNQTNAQTYSNNEYIIETSEIEQKTYRPIAPVENSENQRVIQGENYQVVLGFEDILSEDFYSIHSSTSLMDYGRLYPTNPVVRDLKLKIDAGSTHGYSVLAYEDHSLSDPSFINLIPDTSCDRGLCSQSISAYWEDSLTYGLGFGCENIKGKPCLEEESNLFRKFSDESKGEKYEPVLKNDKENDKGAIDEGKIIFKLNISSSQENSIYSNTINYILVPNL